MSAIAIQNTDCLDIEAMTQGVSEPALITLKVAREAIKHFTATTVNETPKMRLEDELHSIGLSCRYSDWDGYGAKPVNTSTIENAKHYLSLLSKKIPAPEVTPEPDGEVALEWYGSGGSVFSISFSENNVINYAGLFADHRKTHGVECIDPSDKNFIETLKLLEKFISRAVTD